MSELRFLRPADGVKVRHPNGRHLSAEGEQVEITAYWRRRIAAGDVVEGKAPARAAAEKVAGDGRNKGKRES